MGTLPKEIHIYPDQCCGCMLCSLICSALHDKSFCPTKAYITIRGDLHEAHFSITIDEGCERCFACVKMCPTGSLQEEGEDDQAPQN